MGPAILARAGAAVGSFAAKVHGSALYYTVMPAPRPLPALRPRGDGGRPGGARRLPPHRREPLGDGRARGLPEKTRLGPPGVDVEAFAPLPDGADRGRDADGARDAARRRRAGRTSVATSRRRRGGDPRAMRGASGPRVVFVGKLIVSKGCDLLLAAWPLVVAPRIPARDC